MTPVRMVLRSAFVVSLAFASWAAAQTQTAVEYYYAAWNYYFVTAFPDEIAVLDAGAFGGVWKRTGQTFEVWTGPTNGALPTCRFFTITFAPKSSHFYTPYAAECAAVKNNPNWQFESIAFYLQLPDANGICPPGTVILYRLYNNGMGGAPNHRFTISLATFNQMQSQGWIFEGDARTGAFACVPATVIPGTAEGQWRGTTSTNETALGIVLDDGTYYILYSQPGSSLDAGVVQGSSVAANGELTSPDAVDFPIQLAEGVGGNAIPATVSGSYVPRVSLQLTIGEPPGGDSRTLSASYDATYEQPASLAAAAGTYTGEAGHVAGAGPITFTLDASGNISGTDPASCIFKGTVTPHKSVNVFDWSVTATVAGSCPFAKATVSGILYYDEPNQRIHGFAPFGGRTDHWYLIGTKQ